MPVASFHLAHFPLRRSISRFLVVPAERWEVNDADGCRLGKVMGTSRDGTTKTSVDFGRWALFAVWETSEHRDAFLRDSALMNRWRGNARTMRNYALDPIASHGSWGGSNPFPDLVEQRTSDDSKIAVLTRAKVRWPRVWRFTRAIPPVDKDLFATPACSMAIGMGEWPVGEQATFSIWESAAAIRQFAYEGEAHKRVIERRAAERWYSEELFTRFSISEL